MSKYKAAVKGQTSLLSFGHCTIWPCQTSSISSSPVSSSPVYPDVTEIEVIDLTNAHEPTPKPEIQPEVEDDPPSIPPSLQARYPSLVPCHPLGLDNSDERHEEFAALDDIGNEMDEWELEADAETLLPKAVPEVRPWTVLQEQIKADLKKGSCTLPLAKINQLIILHTPNQRIWETSSKSGDCAPMA